MNERQTIKYLIDVMEFNMQELYEIPAEKRSDFAWGQIYALSECMEILQHCPLAIALGLYYDIQKRYPID